MFEPTLTQSPQVRKNFCGADYPIYMEGDHAEKGSCKQQILRQVYADNNWTWRSVSSFVLHDQLISFRNYLVKHWNLPEVFKKTCNDAICFSIEV